MTGFSSKLSEPSDADAFAAARSAAPTIPGDSGPPPPVEEDLWLVAVTDDDQQELSTVQLIDAFKNGVIDEYTYVWREGMGDWLVPFDVPALAPKLRALGFEPERKSTPFGDEAADSAGARAERASSSSLEDAAAAEGSGVWREPGLPALGDDDDSPRLPQLGDAIGFDDVTVAMTREEIEAAQESSVDNEPPAPISGSMPSFDEHTEKDGAALVDKNRDSGVGFSSARDETDDLFAGIERAGSEEHLLEADDDDDDDDETAALPPASTNNDGSLTGARNESSVLFSLDALVKSQPAAKEQRVDEDALFGSSGGDTTSPNAGAPLTLPDFGSPAVSELGQSPSLGSSPMLSADLSSLAPPVETKQSSKGTVWAAVVVLLILLAAGVWWAKQNGMLDAYLPMLGLSVVAPVAGLVLSASAAAPTPEGPPSASATPLSGEPESGEQDQATSKGGGAATTGTGVAQPSAVVRRALPEGGARADEPPPFDVEAAKERLNVVAANAVQSCRQLGAPEGQGLVSVYFAPSGKATRALVGGDFTETAAGSCLARIFETAEIPAFAGEPQVVQKTVHLR
jgi:hypothetical protein